MYVKVYPTYDLAGALFGVVASRPHEWVNPGYFINYYNVPAV